MVAHRRARAQLGALKSTVVVMPDQVVDRKRTIKLGGAALELVYTGRNRWDSSLVMLLPKEKILFADDSIRLAPCLFGWPSMIPIPSNGRSPSKRTLALGWERQIPGHPGPGGRLGTRQDMEQQLAFMTELFTEVKKESNAGKCFDPATKEVRLPKYATLQTYEQKSNIRMLVRLLGPRI